MVCVRCHRRPTRAAKADDDAALVAIFGEKHKNLIASPDRAANSVTRAKMATALQTFRVLNAQGANRRVLLIGDQAWPLPIPIVRVNDRWRYATEEGDQELNNHRIGANERNAIYVLRAYLDAQKAYAAKARDEDAVRRYAEARQHVTIARAEIGKVLDTGKMVKRRSRNKNVSTDSSDFAQRAPVLNRFGDM